MRIGIIGFGFVGQAIGWAHRNDELLIRDPKLQDSIGLDKFIDCDAVYVCVPSPPRGNLYEDGHCDTAILEQTLSELLFVLINKPIPIICKTTAPPSVYKRLLAQYPNIVHCPEFLTAANNVADYQNAKYMILGGNLEWTEAAQKIIRTSVPVKHENYIKTYIETASLFKYMMNSYLATKVTFLNDWKKLSDRIGVEWADMKFLSLLDGRAGPTHLDVPGPDGEYGWGGACFPKDVAAIMEEALDLGVELELLGRVEEINKKHRKL